MTRSRYERVLSQIEARRTLNGEEALASLLEPSQVAMLDPDETSSDSPRVHEETPAALEGPDGTAAEAPEDEDRPLSGQSTEDLIRLLAPDTQAQGPAPPAVSTTQ